MSPLSTKRRFKLSSSVARQMPLSRASLSPPDALARAPLYRQLLCCMPLLPLYCRCCIMFITYNFLSITECRSYNIYSRDRVQVLVATTTMPVYITQVQNIINNKLSIQGALSSLLSQKYCISYSIHYITVTMVVRSRKFNHR